MFENQQRKGLQIDPEILSSIKTADSRISTKHLAEDLGLPYHKVQKIRSGTTYRSVHLDGEQPNLEESWDYFENLVASLLTSYPEEVRRYQLEYHVTTNSNVLGTAMVRQVTKDVLATWVNASTASSRSKKATAL